MWNNIVRLYFDSCHISVHLKKKLHKTGEFCVAIWILKVEGKSNVLAYYALLFQER